MAVKNWPMLYSKSRTGQLRGWHVSAVNNAVIVEHGAVDGATVFSRRTATPKNIGRSNETTGEQQAVLEAEADYKHKLERKYSLTPEEAQEDLALPMLATDINKVVNNKNPMESLFPGDLQRKFDGNRAKARWQDGRVVLESRAGKEWTATPHINKALETILPKGDEFDGELYLHGKTLQWITSRAKKVHPDSVLLEYHVYDAPVVDGDDSQTWRSRLNWLEFYASHPDWASYTNCPVKLVETIRVDSYEQAKALHDKWVLEGYEGAILRLLDGVYEFGYRSKSLLKIKVFKDAEFEIIGHTSEDVARLDSKGNRTVLQAVIWKCQNDLTDQTFDTRPKGTYADRAILFRHAKKFYGRKLTVRFFNRTPDDLPFLPIGHVIRAEEDMD